jgi:hypothetical protein
VSEIHDLLIFKYMVYVGFVGSWCGIELVHPSGAYNFEVAPRFSINLCTPSPSAVIFVCLKHITGSAVCSVWGAIDLRPAMWILPDQTNRALCKLMFVPHWVGCEVRLCHAFVQCVRKVSVHL